MFKWISNGFNEILSVVSLINDLRHSVARSRQLLTKNRWTPKVTAIVIEFYVKRISAIPLNIVVVSCGETPSLNIKQKQKLKNLAFKIHAFFFLFFSHLASFSIDPNSIHSQTFFVLWVFCSRFVFVGFSHFFSLQFKCWDEAVIKTKKQHLLYLDPWMLDNWRLSWTCFCTRNWN